MSKKARANESDPSSEQNLISSHKLLLIFNLYRSQEEAPNSNNGNGSRGGWSPPLTWWLLHPILNSIIPEASAGNIGISSSNLENLCAYRLSKIIPNTPGQLHTHTHTHKSWCKGVFKARKKRKSVCRFVEKRLQPEPPRADASAGPVCSGASPCGQMFAFVLLPHLRLSGLTCLCEKQGKALACSPHRCCITGGKWKKSPGALNVNVVSWVKAGALA